MNSTKYRYYFGFYESQNIIKIINWMSEKDSS